MNRNWMAECFEYGNGFRYFKQVDTILFPSIDHVIPEPACLAAVGLRDDKVRWGQKKGRVWVCPGASGEAENVGKQ